MNFPNLFTDLCRLLPPETAERLLQRYRDPHESPTGLMLALLDAFPSGRSVVLLDNFEDLVDVGTTAITDSALDEALRALLSAPAHGVKVILTTRVAPQSLLLHQPGVQQRINLDEGLPSPYAEELLRARDPDGTLGLKHATEAQLSLARERTRGYPRALEALAAILSADRNTTLPDLLTQTAQLPDNVVEALVGQAFHRLDPLAQQIMQALAIYPVPVPAVGVDYLLQPYQPAIDSAQVLARLVNMQFVRRDAGRYYLHQVDRDYALGRVPAGRPGDGDADPPPFTLHALRSRGADYFTRVQTPREEWKTLDDLAPQLAEFELRCQNETYDIAAAVLFGIDFNCLMHWGHYRLAIDLHTRLQGHLTDPWIVAGSKGNLSLAYRTLGEFPKAIMLLEQALAIDRETGNRDGEESRLGELANCYYELGQLPRAIEFYERALTIAQELGDREGEAVQLGNLGNCYADLGQTARAVEACERALGIARAIGNRREEATNLDRLAIRHVDLGEMQQAITLYEQALTINRDLGYRYGEAIDLANLGQAYAFLGQWERAIGYSRQAVEVADAIGSAQVQAGARYSLALTHLFAGDLPSARQVVEAGRDHPHPSTQADFALLSGIVHLRHGATDTAAEAFREAIADADSQLQQSPANYSALDTKATALAGLSLAGPTDRSDDAIATFRAARNVTTAAGIVTGVLRRLDTLAPADPAGVLYRLRPAAAGFER